MLICLVGFGILRPSRIFNKSFVNNGLSKSKWTNPWSSFFSARGAKKAGDVAKIEKDSQDTHGKNVAIDSLPLHKQSTCYSKLEGVPKHNLSKLDDTIEDTFSLSSRASEGTLLKVNL